MNAYDSFGNCGAPRPLAQGAALRESPGEAEAGALSWSTPAAVLETAATTTLVEICTASTSSGSSTRQFLRLSSPYRDGRNGSDTIAPESPMKIASGRSVPEEPTQAPVYDAERGRIDFPAKRGMSRSPGRCREYARGEPSIPSRSDQFITAPIQNAPGRRRRGQVDGPRTGRLSGRSRRRRRV